MIKKLQVPHYTSNNTIMIDEGIIYEQKSNYVSSQYEKKLNDYWKNLISETDNKLYLPRHLKISPEDFDL